MGFFGLFKKQEIQEKLIDYSFISKELHEFKKKIDDNNNDYRKTLARELSNQIEKVCTQNLLDMNENYGLIYRLVNSYEQRINLMAAKIHFLSREIERDKKSIEHKKTIKGRK